MEPIAREGMWNCGRCTFEQPIDHDKPYCTKCEFVSGRPRRAALKATKRISALHDIADDQSHVDSDIEESEDLPHNEADENRVRKCNQLAYEGSLMTQHEETKASNKAYISKIQEDDPPVNSRAILSEMTLVIIVGLSQAYRVHANMRVNESQSIKTYSRGGWFMQRTNKSNDCQMYVGWGFHQNAHFTLGSVSLHQFQADLGGVRNQFKTLSNERDYHYSSAAPTRPVVINTYSFMAKARFGSPPSQPERLLSHFKRAFFDGFNESLLREFFNHAEVNHRRVASLNLGFTGSDGKGWQRANDLGSAEPGLINRPLSKSFMGWIAKLGVVAMYDLFCSAFEGTDREGCYKQNDDRAKYAKRFAKSLGLPEQYWPVFLCEGITINIGNIIGFHFDKLNDWRKHHDALGVGSVWVDLSKYIKDPLLIAKVKQVLGVNAIGENLITFITYPRVIVGAKVDQANGVKCPSSASFLAFREFAQELVEAKGVHDFLDIQNLRFPEYRLFLKESLQSNPSKDYRGLFCLLPEGVTKMFYYSSFIHVIFKFGLTYHEWVTYADLEEICCFVASECNGQMLIYAILTDWINGTYLGIKGAFLRKWNATKDNEEECLYTLLSHEFMLRKPKQKRKKWFVSATYPRCVQSSELLYQGRKGDSEKVRGRKFAFKAVLANARKAKWTSKRIYDELMRIPGVGHLSSLQGVQLASMLGLIPIKHSNFGTVSNGKYGPANFFNRYSDTIPEDAGKRLSKKQCLKLFDEITRGMPRCGYHWTERTCENGLCLADRVDRDEVKKDVIFWDEDLESGSFQNFYRVCRQSPTGRNSYYRLQFLYKNEWMNFSQVLVSYCDVKDLSSTTKLHVGPWFKRGGAVCLPQVPFV